MNNKKLSRIFYLPTYLPFLLLSTIFLVGCQNNSESQYFLSPLVQESESIVTTGKSSVSSNPSKGLVFPDMDVLNTEVDGLEFDLYYSSTGNHDGATALGNGWRHSYMRYLDPQLSNEPSQIKSQAYASAEQACLNGWSDIKDQYYSGGLSESRSTYDEVNQLCVIKDQKGAVKTQFVIWDDNANVVSQVKRLTRENGKTLLLVKSTDADDVWVPLSGGVAKLTHFNGEWLYQDKNDNIEYYNSDGQLIKIDRQGVETVVEYNKSHFPVKIVNQSTHQFVNFDYSDDGRVWSIENGNTGKSVSIYFDVNNNLETVDLEGSIQKNYQYNVDGLLVQRYAVTPKGDFITHFEYDIDGRLIAQKNSEKNVVRKKSVTQVKQVSDNATPPADIEITLDQIPADTQVNFDYQSNQLIATDQNGDLSTFTYDLINSKDLVIKKETGGVVQEFNYDAEGNLTQVQSQVASGVTSKALSAQDAENNYQVDLAYNNRNQLIRAEVSSKGLGGKSSDVQRANNNHYVVEYGYQDSRWNRSTLKKVGDRLEILELNQKGQVKAAYKAKLNSSGLKNRSLKSLTSSDYKTTSRIEYNYDATAHLKSVNDNGKQYQLNYKSNGKLKSIVLPSGQKVLRNRLKPSQKSLHDVVDKNKALTQAQVNALPTIGGASVATVFVGGGGDSWINHTVEYYEGNNYGTVSDVNYAPWWEIDNLRVLGGVTSLSDFDNKNGTILIGHSWGGDAALEYADWNPVDLVVSIDPVGHVYNVGWRAKTHINVIADPGAPFSVTWQRIRVCCCCCWGCCSSYVWVPKISYNWNRSDWIAHWGGKYTGYFWFPRWGGTDDNIIYHGHHNEFVGMLSRVGVAYSRIGFVGLIGQ